VKSIWCVYFLQRKTGDNTILLRALDRFHRRLQAMNKLLPDTDFSRYAGFLYCILAHSGKATTILPTVYCSV